MSQVRPRFIAICSRATRALAIIASITPALVLWERPGAGQPIEPPASEPAAGEPDPLAIKLLEAHNRERAAKKLPPLALDARLTRAATAHARDMAEHDEMSHKGSDGSQPAERVKRVGFHYIRTGENVAAGQPDVGAAMDSWMNSPGHRRNILGEYSLLGGARAEGEDGRPYWCAVFGTPLPRLEPSKAAREVVERLNRARKEKGSVALKSDPRLAEVAMAIAAEKAKAGTIRGNGEEKADDLVRRLKDAGLSLRRVSRSLAAGQPDPASLVESLLKDPEQNRDVSERFSIVGVGYERDADDTPYWCILLGEP